MDWKWVLEILRIGESCKMIMNRKEKGRHKSLQNYTRLQYGKVGENTPNKKVQGVYKV